MERNRNKSGYKKFGQYTEVRVAGKNDYNSVVAECQTILELSGKVDDFALFRSDGTIIPRKGFHTIGAYFESMKKTPAQIKFGIGHTCKV